ncbi:hypothetical protein DUNSADRAFT_3594 [Dunaliella salina]|uniref:RRM domain-containing protein n=1 Tax=Dunaliella salina TaxID=3046 RepID=A0ABQ7GTS0_DUNSA|nr:hypothetical protein DUNSADRAFT_3594 [Dunaliella salina]|eukprot:KAF5838001.1 hypothetical protein DUNSADRAFT_3594 [Dunaliella salina]
MAWRADNPPVCPEPKVFAGQLPFEVTTADVQNLFSQYGELRSCQVVCGPDGRSKGCAMIMFNSWTQAELAIEGENNTTHLGGSKPMVVKFADPPKRGDGPIMGIAPKKLFVGQIPTTMPEEALHAMFAPFGNITELHMLRKNPGAGCAFVMFDRWSSCEAAIAGLHGKTHLEGAKMPLVVKFADAKIDEFGVGSKRAYDVMSQGVFAGGMGAKKPFTGAGMGAGAGFGPYGMGAYGMAGMNPMAAGMGAYGMGGMGMGMGGMGMGMNGMGGMPGMPGMGPTGLRNQPKLNAGNSAMQASKLGTGTLDESAKQWKLFVGQVPFEATEADLWSIFSTVGNILELVVLRTPQGKSKGCAFVTYETRALAEKAIRQMDGQVCVPDDPKQRLLIVKYAGGQGATPGSAAASLVSSGGGDVGAIGAGSGYGGMDAGMIGPQAMAGMAQPGPQHAGVDPYAQHVQMQQQAAMQQMGMGGMQQQPGMGAPGMAPAMGGMGAMPGGMGF